MGFSLLYLFLQNWYFFKTSQWVKPTDRGGVQRDPRLSTCKGNPCPQLLCLWLMLGCEWLACLGGSQEMNIPRMCDMQPGGLVLTARTVKTVCLNYPLGLAPPPAVLVYGCLSHMLCVWGVYMICWLGLNHFKYHTFCSHLSPGGMGRRMGGARGESKTHGLR